MYALRILLKHTRGWKHERIMKYNRKHWEYFLTIQEQPLLLWLVNLKICLADIWNVYHSEPYRARWASRVHEIQGAGNDLILLGKPYFMQGWSALAPCGAPPMALFSQGWGFGLPRWGPLQHRAAMNTGLWCTFSRTRGTLGDWSMQSFGRHDTFSQRLQLPFPLSGHDCPQWTPLSLPRGVSIFLSWAVLGPVSRWLGSVCVFKLFSRAVCPARGLYMLSIGVTCRFPGFSVFSLCDRSILPSFLSASVL